MSDIRAAEAAGRLSPQLLRDLGLPPTSAPAPPLGAAPRGPALGSGAGSPLNGLRGLLGGSGAGGEEWPQPPAQSSPSRAAGALGDAAEVAAVVAGAAAAAQARMLGAVLYDVFRLPTAAEPLPESGRGSGGSGEGGSGGGSGGGGGSWRSGRGGGSSDGDDEGDAERELRRQQLLRLLRLLATASLVAPLHGLAAIAGHAVAGVRAALARSDAEVQASWRSLPGGRPSRRELREAAAGADRVALLASDGGRALLLAAPLVPSSHTYMHAVAAAALAGSGGRAVAVPLEALEALLADGPTMQLARSEARLGAPVRAAEREPLLVADAVRVGGEPQAASPGPELCWPAAALGSAGHAAPVYSKDAAPTLVELATAAMHPHVEAMASTGAAVGGAPPSPCPARHSSWHNATAARHSVPAASLAAGMAAPAQLDARGLLHPASAEPPPAEHLPWGGAAAAATEDSPASSSPACAPLEANESLLTLDMSLDWRREREEELELGGSWGGAWAGRTSASGSRPSAGGSVASSVARDAWPHAAAEEAAALLAARRRSSCEAGPDAWSRRAGDGRARSLGGATANAAEPHPLPGAPGAAGAAPAAARGPVGTRAVPMPGTPPYAQRHLARPSLDAETAAAAEPGGPGASRMAGQHYPAPRPGAEARVIPLRNEPTACAPAMALTAVLQQASGCGIALGFDLHIQE